MSWTIRGLLGAALIANVAAAQLTTAGLANLTLMNNHGAYSVWVTVGTPPQLQECLVDMTMSDSYFIWSNLSQCIHPAHGQQCDFTFDIDRSSTLYWYPPTFPSFVSSSTNFSGSFVADNVQVGVDVVASGTAWDGGISLWNATFGLAENGTGTAACVVGLGLPNGESSVTTMENGVVSPVYDNFPISIKNQGFVNRASYSVYLNSWKSKEGFVLFGGIDHAKYNGNLSIVPLIDYAVDASLGTKLVGNPTDFQVVLNGISVTHGNTTLPIASTNFAVSIAFGNPFTALPASIVTPIAKVLGWKLSSSGGYYIMPCGREGTINFNLSGVEIAVPLVEFASETGTKMANGEPACLILMEVQDDPLWLLGDPFVRATYLYVDLERFQVAFAPVNYTTDSDIEVVTADGEITGSQYAPLFNNSKLSTNVSAAPVNTTFYPVVQISAGVRVVPSLLAVLLSALLVL